MSLITSKKTCRCHTCGRNFHYLGIARHRAMHRDDRGDCKITYTDGGTSHHNFSDSDDMREHYEL